MFDINEFTENLVNEDAVIKYVLDNMISYKALSVDEVENVIINSLDSPDRELINLLLKHPRKKLLFRNSDKLDELEYQYQVMRTNTVAEHCMFDVFRSIPLNSIFIIRIVYAFSYRDKFSDLVHLLGLGSIKDVRSCITFAIDNSYDSKFVGLLNQYYMGILNI